MYDVYRPMKYVAYFKELHMFIFLMKMQAKELLRYAKEV